MNWLDIKLLATIGASAAVGVSATATLLDHSKRSDPFDQAVLSEAVAVIHIQPETPNLHHADLIHWWGGEAPIRFSGPGARGFDKKGRSRRRSGFRLKDPPRRLGFERSVIGTLVEVPEFSRPSPLQGIGFYIRPPDKH